jgi:hypothetical protein
MVNSQFISDSELLDYINASYAELYDLLIQTYEDYYITGPTQFTLTSGDEGVYALPSDFYKLRGLDYQYGGDWVELYPYDWNRRNAWNRTLNRVYTGETERSYRMVGTNLRIEPDDDADGTYRIWYAPAYTALSSDTDNIDSMISRNNWEEYLIIDAAIKMLAKEESDTRALERQKADIKRRIESAAGDRDMDQPERISDIRDIRGEDWFR